jgi:DNA-binding beta-propeller fold protein YncE
MPADAAGRQAVIVLAVGLSLVAVGLLVVFARARPAVENLPPNLVPDLPATTAASKRAKAEKDAGDGGLGRLVATFGGKGTAAGLYQDARVIAVDPESNTYVGEYSSGRIHVFDATGKFVRVFDVPPKDGRSYLFGMAADWSGNLFVSRAHEVIKLALKDNSTLLTIQERGRPDRKKALPNEVCARAIALDAAGQLFVASNCTPEGMSVDIDPPNSLVKFDPKGKQIGHYASKGDFETAIAVEGTGTVYLVPESGNSVYVYDANGNFQNKWGQSGNDPGDFPSPLSGVAVDGHGHVLVLTWRALQAFDTNGKYRGHIAFKGGRAVAMGPKGEAYVLDDDGVRKYEFTLPP